MKQLLLKTWLMLVCLIVGVGTSWAETKTITVRVSSFTDLPASASYGTYSWSEGGVSGKATIYASSSSTYLQFNGSNRLFFSTTAIPGNIVSVKLKKNSGSDRAFCVYGRTSAYDGSSSTYGTQIGSSTAVTTSGTTFNVTSGEYNYFVVRNNTSSAAYLDYVEVTYEVAGGPTLSSIAVKTAPTKTTYTEGETFNPAGLVITKTLSNANTEDVAYSGNESSFTFEPSLETELSDETSVTITYGKKTTTQAITVNPFVPAAGTYTINTNNGLYGVSTGNNGTEQSVTKKGITIVSGCTSSATSKTYYDTDHIRYYADSYLKLTAPAGYEITKVVFTANGTWNSGPKCGTNGTYDNTTKTWEGSTSQLDLTFSDQNRIKSIAVTYSSVKTLQSVTVSGAPTKTTYTAGESFEPAGLTVTGHYDDESDETITEGITWSTPAALTAGQTSVGITATVGGVTSAEYTVTGLTVNAPLALSSITATGTPAEFWKGDTFNHNGITITATWSDESTTDVTSSCTFTGYDMSTPGQQTVTVTYQGETCQYGIEVKTIANTQETAYTVAQAKALIDAGKDLATEVYVAGTVSQIVTEYNSSYGNISFNVSADGQTTGDQFQFYRNFKGADKQKWTDDDTKPAEGDLVVGFGKLTKYNSTYEFAEGNYIVSLTHPAAKELTSIAVSGTPNKTTYIEGEPFDPTGLVVTGTYSDASTKVLSDDAIWTVNPSTGLTLGTTSVSVVATVGELASDSYIVDGLTVTEKPLELEVDFENAASTYTDWDLNNISTQYTNDNVTAHGGTKMGATVNASNNGVASASMSTKSKVAFPQSITFYVSKVTTNTSASSWFVEVSADGESWTKIKTQSATSMTRGNWVEVSQDLHEYQNVYVRISYSGSTAIRCIDDVVLECSKYIPVTFKTAGLGYATVYCDRALSIPEGVEAYYTTLNGNGYMEPHALTDVIPAETGVVLKYTGELNADEVVAFSYTSKAGEDVSDNVLTGTTTDIVNPGNAYVFSVVNEEPGFYKYADGATLGANKAYYVPSASSDVQSFVLDFEGLTTSISNVSTGSNLNGSFDLQGRRVNAATRGLFIQNGKKVIK